MKKRKLNAVEWLSIIYILIGLIIGLKQNKK